MEGNSTFVNFTVERAVFVQKSLIRTILTFALVVAAIPLWAQSDEAKIELGPDEVGLNQAWPITITVETDRLQHSSFPDINGFRKHAPFTQSMKSIINGKVSVTQSV